MGFVCLCLPLLIFFQSATASNSSLNEVVINTKHTVCVVNEKFLSVAIDSKFIFKHNLSALLHEAVFINILRGLQPAFLRLGGTAADLVIFDNEENNFKNTSDLSALSILDTLSMDFDSQSCLSRQLPILHLSSDQWLIINEITRRAGLNLLFDLNVLVRQTSGDWDPTNAEKLISFSQINNLYLDWQLGNEPNSFCHVFGQNIKPGQLATDFKTLSNVLKKYPLYGRSLLVGPDVTAPRGPKKRQALTLKYLGRFLSKAKKTISAASWHQYYFNGRNATKREFMDPAIMDILKREIKDVKDVVMKNIDEYFPLWITETSSAYGGGAPELSNRFLSGFTWLDKLGMAASHNISVVVRQSLIGGNYGLLDTETLQPNPDFWVSYLFKMLVGRIVLTVGTTPHNSFIRLYAHCCLLKSKSGRHAVVVFGMNLSTSDYKGLIMMNHTNFSNLLSIRRFVLTAPDGQMDSRTIQLNGKTLKITRSENLPHLKPVINKTNFIDLPPQSLGFFVIDGLSAPVCG